MNSVDRVKTICKERKIPISKLERDLGYANGYIGQLRKGVFPANRLSEIATYLSVSTDYLMTGEETKKAPTPVTEDGREAEAKRLFEALSNEGKASALNYLRYLAANSDNQ